MLDDTKEIKIKPRSSENRGNWYLLTGLLLGLVLGLVYAWLINPVVYVNTEPASLDTQNKAIYRLLIAQTFASTGHIRRAQDRIDLLADQDPVMALGAQAQKALANGDIQDAQALSALASALSEPAIEQDNFETPPMQSVTLTPAIEIETVPTQTLPHPSPTP